jgi:hypothetical protein
MNTVITYQQLAAQIVGLKTTRFLHPVLQDITSKPLLFGSQITAKLWARY